MTQPRLVGGRYELGELIGFGGMAEVHRGRDIRLGRDVAIKVLRADLARDPSFLNRFRREAQAAAGLNHASIVSVYDTGEDVAPDGGSQPYIVMEFVQGRTLREVLKAEGRLPAHRVMEIGADIAGALDFSHRNGIVHRDIKPANVMITNAGAVKVMDFGIARATADNSATVTQTANVIGTAQYLSPEQARGEAVDARSDVYSTGCLLYELATGSPPFQGDSPVAIAYQHVRENPAPPSARNPDVPAALDSIIMKSLAKNQLNRYQSAGEMRTDLQRALANQPVAAEAVLSDAERTQFIAHTAVPLPLPPPEYEADDRRGRKTGLIWLAVVLALLLVVGGLVAFFVVTKKDNSGPTPIAVPNLTGRTVEQAVAQLKGLGFSQTRAGDHSNGPCHGNKTVKEGHVCDIERQLVTASGSGGAAKAGDTEPAIGQSLPPNTVLLVRGFVQKVVTVPNVEGKPWAEASTLIKNAGLDPARGDDINTAQTAGSVVKQSPDPFATAKPGATVTLQLSSGKVVLPRVAGEKLNEAQSELNGLGYTNIQLTRVITRVKEKNDLVLAQSPTENIAYPLDQQITLTVGRYQPACTTPPPATTSAPAPSTTASSTPPPSITANSTPPQDQGQSGNNAVAPPNAAPAKAAPTPASNDPLDNIPTPTC